MRLTLVISSLRCGGAERVMSAMANYWAERGEEVSVVTLDGGGAPFYSLHQNIRHLPLGLTAASYNAIEGFFRNLRRVHVLRRAIWNSGPEVVISFVDKTNILTLIALRGLRVPVIVSERVDPTFYNIGIGWSFLRRIGYRWADALVCQTSAVLERFGSNTIERGVVIPNPVDVPPPRSHRAVANRTDRDPHKVVAMGRLVSQKGFDILISAFSAASNGFANWSLEILGEGPQREVLERQVESLELGGRVSFTGHVRNPYAILQTADIFVLSSRFEGFPNALLEAMACGLPVVSFDCPSGPREIIRDGIDGVLVPPENAEALAATLTCLMGDSANRQKLAERAPEVLERFGMAKIMAKWDELVVRVRR